MRCCGARADVHEIRGNIVMTCLLVVFVAGGIRRWWYPGWGSLV